jgi:AAA domain
LRFELFEDITAETIAKRWVFKGAMARGETSAWIAPPGGLKSALMAEASICAASGADWHGHRNKGAVGVV